MDLLQRLSDAMPSVRADLEDLVRIPSVGAIPAHADDVRRSAEATARLLEGAGLEVEILSVDGGAPAVVGHRDGPAGAPTVLLYAHHDVQPTCRVEDWASDPFEPTERDGRLYGRGAADDKAGIAVHLAALRAHGDDLPVGVVVLVEGEEEEGSPTLEAFLAAYRDRLAADVIVIADSTNWEVGVPALTTSLRGLTGCDIEVSALDHGVHSGMFGGPVPDALTALCRLLATLHDDAGEVAVEGLVTAPVADLDYPEDRFRAEASVLDGVDLIGSGSIVERLWGKPALSVIGIDAPSLAESSNTLVPRARAAISMRVAPGQDVDEALRLLLAHLESHAPWGVQVRVLDTERGAPTQIDATGPAYDAAREAFAEAWDGTQPVDMGVGGSIPFIAAFRDAYPDAAVLVTGVEDPDTRAHGTDESLHLAEFERCCRAETLLLRNLGRLGRT